MQPRALARELDLRNPAQRVATGRRVVQGYQQRLHDRYDRDHAGLVLVSARTAFVDALLELAWAQFRSEHPALERLALVAVGGYGRGELHPASDIDLSLIHI